MTDEAAASGDAARTKVVLVEPAAFTVVWMNEAALHDFGGSSAEAPVGLPVEVAMPLARSTGVPEALRTVALTGEPHHLRTSLVSTTKGRVAIVTSVYRLPDGALLLVTENAWETGARSPASETAGASRSHRRRR